MSRQEPWTYSSLTEALHHRSIILRVHTTPHDPLESGFTARNPVFKGLTVEQYHHATASLKGERWAEGPYMRDVIIDHINQLIIRPQPQRPGKMGNGWFRQPQPQSHLRYQGRQNISFKEEVDELTPWISTTANLDWALWYISKLLSLPGNGPRNNPGMKHNTVKLAIISISTDRTYNKELYVAPFLWRPPNEIRYMCQVDRERYNRAKKSAISAKEVLFYGRIFKESILADLTFTKDNLPFTLPSVYYNPPEMHNPTFASSWMGRLRWDPRLLNYEMAQYNRMKMMGPRCFWGNQPVDPRLQEFQRNTPRQYMPQDTRRVEVVIRPPGRREGIEKEEEVPIKVLVGHLVSHSLSPLDIVKMKVDVSI